MIQTTDWRSRNHPAYWAFLAHRVSGLLLALFLPAHFWALSRAIDGEAEFLAWRNGQKTAIALSAGFGLAFGLAFLLAIF